MHPRRMEMKNPTLFPERYIFQSSLKDILSKKENQNNDQTKTNMELDDE
jgi:hypothetical protein